MARKARAVMASVWQRIRGPRVRTWFRGLGNAGKALVIAVVVAAAGAAGGGAWAVIEGLAHSPDDDYRLTVEANPDNIQTTNGPLGGAYIMSEAPEDVGAPPNHADSCVGRYDWARQHGGVDAGSTTVNARIEGTNDNLVHIEGITPVVLTRNAPKVGAFYTCGGRGGEPSIRGVTVDLDQRPPTAVTSDAKGNPAPLTFQVQQGDSETFQITATTGGCDCTWNVVVHLVAEGKHFDEIVQDGDKPFETSAPTNATSWRWQDERWKRVDSTQPTAPPTNLAPIQNACSLLSAAEASMASGTTMGGQTPTPPIVTNGITTNAMLNSICGFTGPSPTGTTTTTTVPSLTVMLDGLDSTGAARTEYDARVAMYRTQQTLQTAPITGVDAAYQSPGDVVILKGRLILDVQCQPPSDASKLLTLATALSGRLAP